MNRVIIQITLIPITTLIVSCGSIIQRDMSKNDLPKGNGGEHGVIVGSVAAPPSLHYHETVKFFYRSMGDGVKNEGILTSGERHNLDPFIPSCEENGLPLQCGRLFALSLPAGKYEIYKIRFGRKGDLQAMTPAVFSVQPDKVKYIGNLNITFCNGLVRSSRGGILGADISIMDELERDESLLRKQYVFLNMRTIEKSMLTDYSWSWRVSWEPYDWENCGPPSGSVTPRH